MVQVTLRREEVGLFHPFTGHFYPSYLYRGYIRIYNPDTKYQQDVPVATLKIQMV